MTCTAARELEPHPGFHTKPRLRCARAHLRVIVLLVHGLPAARNPQNRTKVTYEHQFHGKGLTPNPIPQRIERTRIAARTAGAVELLLVAY